MVVTLYKLDASPPVRAVFMTIEALKLQDVEYVDVNVLEGEHLKEDYLKINPQHTIPTLVDDDLTIADSHAIAAYLVNKYGTDDSLYPTDPKERAIVDQRLHFDSGILFPALRGTVEPVFFWGEKAFRPEGLEKIKKAYDFAEKLLTADWMAGDHVTIADFCCVATISTMNEVIPINDNEYPNMASWLERCSSYEFYKKGNSPLNQWRALLNQSLGI